MKRSGMLLLSFLLVVSFAGCDLFQDSGRNMGSVQISIPRYAPWVDTGKDLAESRRISGKAWMEATSVKAELYQGGVLARTETWDIADTFSPSDQTTQTHTIASLYVGPYNKAVISIYNSAVSTTVPVVSGESPQFTIATGTTTTLTVACFPTATTTLAEGIYSPAAALPAHGEKWFKATATDMRTRFYVNTISGDMDLYMFNPDGSYLGRCIGTNPPEDYVTLTTIIGSPFYICMYAVGSGSGQVEFSADVDHGNLTVGVQ